MSTVYQKTINQLSTYLNIPAANPSVKRAIKNLRKQEQEGLIEEHLEMNAAPKIMEILIEENKKRRLTDKDKIRLITREFLLDQKLGDQHFLQLTDSTFSLNGYEGNVFVFVLKFDERDIHFKRLENGEREPKHAGYTFLKLPNLAVGTKLEDKKILKNNLKGLRRELKACWEHLLLDKTPSVSTGGTTADDIADIEMWLSSEV